MPKRTLVAVLGATLGLVAMVDALLVAGLAVAHEPFAIPLAGGLCALIPGLVVAGLAWRRRLPACAPSAPR